MNYINQLEQEKAELEAQVAAAREGLQELLKYVNSGKFNCGDELDGYVSCGDVTSRIRNAEQAITGASAGARN